MEGALIGLRPGEPTPFYPLFFHAYFPELANRGCRFATLCCHFELLHRRLCEMLPLGIFGVALDLLERRMSSDGGNFMRTPKPDRSTRRRLSDRVPANTL